MTTEVWEPDDIVVPDRLRAGIREDAVTALMESIQRIGPREPPTIRIAKDESGGEFPILVAGRHRVEACKRLGMKDIDCIVFDGDEVEARLWEIAENLHRAELSAQERAEHISEWVRLTMDNQDPAKPAQVAQVSAKGGRGVAGGLSAAVRELGIERTDAQRALKIASMSPAAKLAAVAAEFDDNQIILLRIADEPTEEAQLAAIRREAEQQTARKASPRTSKSESKKHIEKVASYIMDRLVPMDQQELGRMLVGLCDPLAEILNQDLL